jgi:hypothetical protein
MGKKAKARKCTLPTQEKAVALPLNEAEKEIISKHFEKIDSNPVNGQLVDKINEDGKSEYQIEYPRGSDCEKKTLWQASICKATGSSNMNFAKNIYTSCAHALTTNPSDPKQITDKLNEALVALNAFKPADEIEAMLISKMIVMHFQSMEFFRRSTLENQMSAGIDLNVNRSTKLTRLYNETLETLMRYRRKGEQKVVVQHQYINVNDGGKAVVGGVFEGVGAQ